MGCGGNESVSVQKDNLQIQETGQFHALNEEEKEKIKNQIEQQDKNLEEPVIEEVPYNEFDWDALNKKLPIKKTGEERKERLKLWNQINEYGNGYISYKRLSTQLTKYLKLPEVVRNKGPIKLAFDAASDKYEKYGVKKQDNLIEWMEFRIFLVYLRQYFEYWVMFERMDNSGDNQISFEEFEKSIPLMEKWGVKIDDPQQEFKRIDVNGGGSLTFDEFCSYAIKKSLDLETDDNFDDEELKNLK